MFSDYSRKFQTLAKVAMHLQHTSDLDALVAPDSGAIFLLVTRATLLSIFLRVATIALHVRSPFNGCNHNCFLSSNQCRYYTVCNFTVTHASTRAHAILGNIYCDLYEITRKLRIKIMRIHWRYICSFRLSLFSISDVSSG